MAKAPPRPGERGRACLTGGKKIKEGKRWGGIKCNEQVSLSDFLSIVALLRRKSLPLVEVFFTFCRAI